MDKQKQAAGETAQKFEDNPVIATWLSELECDHVEQIPNMLAKDGLARHIFTLTALLEYTKSFEQRDLNEAIFKLRKELLLMRYILCKAKVGEKGGEQ